MVRLTRRLFFTVVISLVVCLTTIYRLFDFTLNSNYSEHAPASKTLILMWTPVFGSQSLALEDSCDVVQHCTVTYDRATLPSAAAVVYHLFDATPNDFPPKTNGIDGDIIHALLTQESYLNSIASLRQMPKHYFHWLISYMRTAHVPFVYGGYWTPPAEAAARRFPVESLPHTTAEILTNKSRTIFWTVSNCRTKSRREIAVDALGRHISVDVYGKCAKRISLRFACPYEPVREVCEERFRSYYFVIIAENSVCRDYVTEKYWNQYRMPVVPLVLRRHVYEGCYLQSFSLLPTDSFIAFDDFRGPKEMAAHLRYLMATPDAYMRHFRWRAEGWARAPWNAPGYRIGLCGLCTKLLERRTMANASAAPPPPVIADVAEWMATLSACEGGEFAERWAANESLESRLQANENRIYS